MCAYTSSKSSQEGSKVTWCELHNKLDKSVWIIYGYPAMHSPVNSVSLNTVICDAARLCLLPLVAPILFVFPGRPAHQILRTSRDGRSGR